MYCYNNDDLESMYMILGDVDLGRVFRNKLDVLNAFSRLVLKFSCHFAWENLTKTETFTK